MQTIKIDLNKLEKLGIRRIEKIELQIYEDGDIQLEISDSVNRTLFGFGKNIEECYLDLEKQIKN